MIAITAAAAGRPTHKGADACGRTRRPVVLVGVKPVVSTLRALRAAVIATASHGPAPPLHRHRGSDCDPRRSCATGSVAHRGPAARLGDLGRSVVPAGVLGRAHRGDGLSVPPHRVHAGCGPAVRSLPRCPAGRAGQHRQRRHRTAAGARRGLATEPAGPALPGGFAGRAAARARLARGDVDADDSRRAVLGGQLRRRGVGGAGAALHAGHAGRVCCPAPPPWSSSATRSPATSARCCSWCRCAPRASASRA